MTLKTGHKVGIAGLSAAGLIAAAQFITPLEGVATHAYHDQFARGLPTVCVGETEGVKMGDVYTLKQCSDMLAKKLPRYDAEMTKCIFEPISQKEHIAYLSGDYNFGNGAFCKSSMVRNLNARNHIAACNSLKLYNSTKSKGVVPGLVKRRAKEIRLCLEGAMDMDLGAVPEPVAKVEPVAAPKKKWWQ